MQIEFGIEFPLVLGIAEAVPYEDDAFGFAISEYGAALWCDPYLWIPEAARILVPGGSDRLRPAMAQSGDLDGPARRLTGAVEVTTSERAGCLAWAGHGRPEVGDALTAIRNPRQGQTVPWAAPCRCAFAREAP
ncbi:hypothetical protein GCM10023322_11730 [Rugosimonospora acidiphila]|uniref:Uncharacterized protein n=1 Tax=Rugosimonospora acidiphila TaxID=556531 RepID=A0ABP9RN71_9ACTN